MSPNHAMPGPETSIPEDLHLRVFQDRSELVPPGRPPQSFPEGPTTESARERLARIKSALEEGYLQGVIDSVRLGDDLPVLEASLQEVIDALIAGINSEHGRALAGLALLQMTIKAVEPDQSIRLHKGGRGGRQFSWSEGIPMRSLDKSYVTPVLRSNKLLSLNADGIMMTRSLAENYPYSGVYKAQLRGPRVHWMRTVEALENGSLSPADGLRHLLMRLMQRSEVFRKLADDTLGRVHRHLQKANPDLQASLQIIREHVHTSRHSARLLEVAMHSLMQCLEDSGSIDGVLRPLAQMRSANKKAGTIGDIEVLAGQSGEILEAWDAKYGQPYLLDQLEELSEKLSSHAEVETAGFVVDREPDIRPDILERIEEVKADHDLDIAILSFEEWVGRQVERSGDIRGIGRCWILAYAETLCLSRTQRAPIDEPTEIWVRDLRELIKAE